MNQVSVWIDGLESIQHQVQKLKQTIDINLPSHRPLHRIESIERHVQILKRAVLSKHAEFILGDKRVKTHNRTGMSLHRLLVLNCLRYVDAPTIVTLQHAYPEALSHATITTLTGITRRSFRHIRSLSFEYNSTDDIIEILARNSNRLTDLTIPKLYPAIDYFLKRATNLQKLSVEETIRQDTLRGFTKLTELSVTLCNGEHDWLITGADLLKLNRLRTLCVDHITIDRNTICCLTQLVKLSCCDCFLHNCDPFVRLTNLTWLDYMGNDWIVSPNLTFLTNLTYLACDGDVSLTDLMLKLSTLIVSENKLLTNLLNTCSDMALNQTQNSVLKYLKIEDCVNIHSINNLPNLTRMNAQKMNLTRLGSLPSLTDLYLSDCQQLHTIDGLICLEKLVIRRCDGIRSLVGVDRLTHLEVFACSGLYHVSPISQLIYLRINSTPSIVDDMIQNCISLNEARITNNPHITDRAVVGLRNLTRLVHIGTGIVSVNLPKNMQ